MLFDGSGNVVSGNRLTRGTETGIGLAGDDNLVSRNHITGAPAARLRLRHLVRGWVPERVRTNFIAHFRWGIRVDAFAGLASDTVIRKNVVRRAVEDGIVVDQEQPDRWTTPSCSAIWCSVPGTTVSTSGAPRRRFPATLPSGTTTSGSRRWPGSPTVGETMRPPTATRNSA